MKMNQDNNNTLMHDIIEDDQLLKVNEKPPIIQTKLPPKEQVKKEALFKERELWSVKDEKRLKYVHAWKKLDQSQLALT